MNIIRQFFIENKKKNRLKKAREIADATRQTVNSDDSSQGRILRMLASPDKLGGSTEQVYRKLTEENLLDMNPFELSDLMVKNDPTIDKIVDDFIVYALIAFSYNCDNPKGNDVLDEFIDLLNQKRNTFRSSLTKLFTSVILRGELCCEIVFDEEMNASNFFVVDPQFIKFESKNDPIDGQVWVMGQMRGDEFKPITSETVQFESINPLLKDPRGRSLVATAFPSIISDTLMLQDLRKVVKNHAWTQRYILINQIALKDAGFSTDEIEQIIKNDKNLITNEWGNLEPNEIPVGTGEIELRQYEGAAAGRLNFVDTLDRVHDRKSLRGGKTTPAALGSNEFVAESSAEEQGVQQDLRIGSHQDTVIAMIENQLTRVIRSKGIEGKVNFEMERLNTRERKRRVEVFITMMIGIRSAVEAGMDIGAAIKLYENVSREKLPEELVEEIKKGFVRPAPKVPSGDNNDD